MNLYEKLIEVRKEVPYIQKADQGAQYQYTGSSRVLTAVIAKMNELGLLLVPAITNPSLHESPIEYKDEFGNVTKRTTTYFTELEMTMTWINAEMPEEQISVPWYGQGVDIAGEKGVGKALTYAEKYFMLKFFNIATDKDDPDAFQQKHDPNTPVTPTTASGNQSSQSTKETQGSRGTDFLISQPQINLTLKLKKTKKISDEDFNRMVTEISNGKTDIKELTKKQASEFIDLLNNYTVVEKDPFVGEGKPIDISDDDLPF
ncbi:hypothetical protein J2T12_005066 [Paenibacillus anaericanus]|uniref:ERF family protein n=1 Tax=Paenibacillus anaericanus TaxID=170367 RepID=UPI00278118BC|nr:ERF family protein [Paenibacillus anaericanus]MDQ0091626.1 hypothetical protein [Paenibacillus anaericanus]